MVHCYNIYIRIASKYGCFNGAYVLEVSLD